jgi:hypothetical protein
MQGPVSTQEVQLSYLQRRTAVLQRERDEFIPWAR